MNIQKQYVQILSINKGTPTYLYIQNVHKSTRAIQI